MWEAVLLHSKVLVALTFHNLSAQLLTISDEIGSQLNVSIHLELLALTPGASALLWNCFNRTRRRLERIVATVMSDGFKE